MVEITLPCCDTPATLDAETDEVRCDVCGLVHELAPDARPSVEPAVILAAAA
jgi:DNA gyrase inhibitor GyrI